jgi:hypothetical protein
MSRDLEILADQLKRIQGFAHAMRQQLADLHSLAYDRHVGGDKVGTSGWRPPTYNDDVGSAKAKAAWRSCERQVADCHKRLEASLVKIRNLMAQGGPADDSLFGSTISPTEHAERLLRQEQSRRRGEYVPRLNPGVEQPGYPAPKGLCSHCGDRAVRAEGLCPACYQYRAKNEGRLPSQKLLKARRERG